MNPGMTRRAISTGFLFLGDPGELDLLQAEEVVFREGRVKGDVGVDVEGGVEIGFQARGEITAKEGVDFPE